MNDKQQDVINDLKYVFHWLEWHDSHSCLLDVAKAVEIANKYGIKLDLYFDIEDYRMYDISGNVYKALKINQKIV